ncbi:hypothetical protein E24_00352 [Faustovirus]|nr:hypothetical protein E24_00352 [Faustovirus]AMN85239.1 hypothetical protein E23_00352 [Faustovirus]
MTAITSNEATILSILDYHNYVYVSQIYIMFEKIHTVLCN